MRHTTTPQTLAFDASVFVQTLAQKDLLNTAANVANDSLTADADRNLTTLIQTLETQKLIDSDKKAKPETLANLSTEDAEATGRLFVQTVQGYLKANREGEVLRADSTQSSLLNTICTIAHEHNTSAVTAEKAADMATAYGALGVKARLEGQGKRRSEDLDASKDIREGMAAMVNVAVKEGYMTSQRMPFEEALKTVRENEAENAILIRGVGQNAKFGYVIRKSQNPDASENAVRNTSAAYREAVLAHETGLRVLQIAVPAYTNTYRREHKPAQPVLPETVETLTDASKRSLVAVSLIALDTFQKGQRDINKRDATLEEMATRAPTLVPIQKKLMEMGYVVPGENDGLNSRAPHISSQFAQQADIKNPLRGDDQDHEELLSHVVNHASRAQPDMGVVSRDETLKGFDLLRTGKPWDANMAAQAENAVKLQMVDTLEKVETDTTVVYPHQFGRGSSFDVHTEGQKRVALAVHEYINAIQNFENQARSSFFVDGKDGSELLEVNKIDENGTDVQARLKAAHKTVQSLGFVDDLSESTPMFKDPEQKGNWLRRDMDATATQLAGIFGDGAREATDNMLAFETLYKQVEKIVHTNSDELAKNATESLQEVDESQVISHRMTDDEAAQGQDDYEGTIDLEGPEPSRDTREAGDENEGDDSENTTLTRTTNDKITFATRVRAAEALAGDVLGDEHKNSVVFVRETDMYDLSQKMDAVYNHLGPKIANMTGLPYERDRDGAVIGEIATSLPDTTSTYEFADQSQRRVHLVGKCSAEELAKLREPGAAIRLDNPKHPLAGYLRNNSNERIVQNRILTAFNDGSLSNTARAALVSMGSSTKPILVENSNEGAVRKLLEFAQVMVQMREAENARRKEVLEKDYLRMQPIALNPEGVKRILETVKTTEDLNKSIVVRLSDEGKIKVESTDALPVKGLIAKEETFTPIQDKPVDSEEVKSAVNQTFSRSNKGAIAKMERTQAQHEPSFRISVADLTALGEGGNDRMILLVTNPFDKGQLRAGTKEGYLSSLRAEQKNVEFGPDGLPKRSLASDTVR